MLDPNTNDRVKFHRESQDYCKLVLKDVFSSLIIKIEVIQSNKDETEHEKFIQNLYSIDSREEKISDYKLTEGGKFI